MPKPHAAPAPRKPRAGRARYDDLRLEETVGFLLSDVARTMTRAFSARIAAHGVSMSTFQFLRVLWEEDGTSQAALALLTRLQGPSAAAALQELERRGFVRRVADDDDRRKLRVLLTPAGHRLYDVVMPDIAATNRTMLAGFTASEQALLKQMLRRMRLNLAPRPTRHKARETAPMPRSAARRPIG